MLLCCRIVTARGYLYQHVSRKHYLLKSRRFPSALISVSFVMSLAAREICDCFYSGSNFTSFFFFLLSLILFKLFQILLLFLFHRKVSVNLIWLRARVSTVKESSILRPTRGQQTVQSRLFCWNLNRWRKTIKLSSRG